MENLISVVVCTYNQEDTIGRTLDSVLMQQCHVPFEIIIGEDCSTDNTLRVCQTYAEKYPDVIRLFVNNPNKGVVVNYFDCLMAARGKYIADCAGDDYWTDPLKLEKEVAMMENHPDVTMVLTRWNWFNEYTHQLIPGPPSPFNTNIVCGKDILEDIITQTDMSVFHLCTSLYRTDVFRKAYEEDRYIFTNKAFGTEDIQVAFMMARHGNIAYLPDVTMHYSTGKCSASNFSDDERQFYFVSGIMNLCFYLTQHYHLSSQRIDTFFQTRLFALAMHAFRSYNPQLFEQTVIHQKEWNVCPNYRTKFVLMVMRHPWLWSSGLRIRKIFVTFKQYLKFSYE